MELQAKDEELGQKMNEKATRKEIKAELSKAKRALRERDREIARLKIEVASTKRT